MARGFLTGRPARFGLAVFLFLAAGCSDSTDPGCGKPPEDKVDYRAEMRVLSGEVAARARDASPGFLVLARNGLPLLTANGSAQGDFNPDYVGCLDGVVREGVHFRMDDAGANVEPAPEEELAGYLDRLVSSGQTVLATSHCRAPEDTDDALDRSSARGYLGFTTPGPACDVIPEYPARPPAVHAGDVAQLGEAANYLQLQGSSVALDREDYLRELAATDFDILLLDAYSGGEPLSAAEVAELRTKSQGGRRLVLAYLCIGTAETVREYWREEWEGDPPGWLEPQGTTPPGRRNVRYWEPGWKSLVFGSPDALLERILAAGFDGVLLDGLDAYEYFEDDYG